MPPEHRKFIAAAERGHWCGYVQRFAKRALRCVTLKCAVEGVEVFLPLT